MNRNGFYYGSETKVAKTYAGSGAKLTIYFCEHDF